jgi:tetratricopeptide (TPR) repeat protein
MYAKIIAIRAMRSRASLGAEIVSNDLHNLEMSHNVDRPSKPGDLELRRSKQLEFLLTVLQSISDSSADPEVVYPLFHQHLDLLEDAIVELLRNWTISEFAKVDLDSKMTVAAHIADFGNLIHQFPLGNHAINTELSISCYYLALQVFTILEHPESWATIQNNLANAYADRIKGDRAENLELSIECCQSALEVLTKTDLPIDWARTQNNLASTYGSRIKGNRDKNLERSIYCYESALEVLNKTDLPIDWAKTQNNLALIYNKRIKGNRDKNLERSIYCCESALEVLTKTDFPMEWAITKNNLANAYADRIKKDRNDNLGKSLRCYRDALDVYTRELFPRKWSEIQLTLAKFSIEHLQNYQLATEHLQSAYEHLLANDNDTGLLAQTMFELAWCFHKTGCLGQAKIYFKDAIRLYQRLEQPTQIAAATSALGNLELQMGAIDDARIHLQTALEFYQAAGNPDRVASIQELQQCLPEHSPEPAL